MDHNSCVDCPADSAPNGGASCQACGVRSVPKNGVCVPCANNEIEMPDHTCHACPPATPLRLDNTCVASCDCTSTLKACLVPENGACVPSACPAHQIKVGTSCVACATGSISVGGTACTTCSAAASQFQSDNQCLTCAPLSVPAPTAAPTTCQACPPDTISQGGACISCPLDQISGGDNQCHSRPTGQIRLGNACILLGDCTSTAEHCGLTVDPRGFCFVVIC